MEFDRALAQAGEPVLSGTEELHNLLLWLERWTGAANGQARAKGSCCLKIRTSKAARIRILAETGSLRGRVPIVRAITQGGRTETFFLGEGAFTAEISWGPAYRRYERHVRMPEENGSVLAIMPEPMGKLPEGWLMGDLHHHSIYSSPVYGGTDAVAESPAMAALAMRAAGCGFGALSDHHNILNHGDWSREERDDFHPLLSKEISTSNGHVAALGVKTDIIYHIPAGDRRTEGNLKQEFIRILEQIRRENGTAQLNHPFDENASTGWNRNFDDIISLFSAVEIYNGAHPMLTDNGNGRALEWWIGLWQKGHRLTATGGSDTHNILADQFDSDLLIICRILDSLAENRSFLPSGIRQKTDIIEQMGKRSLPHFLDWAGRRLGSACVKTCVYTGEKADAESIRQAIEQGKCMVTDGPLLFVLADGAGPGEHRQARTGEVTLKARIFSEEEPEKLRIILGDGRTLERDRFLAVGGNEYVLEESGISAGQAKWLLCALYSRLGCRAVINPIYL